MASLGITPTLSASATTEDDSDSIIAALESSLPEALDGLSSATTSTGDEVAVEESNGSFEAEVSTEPTDGIQIDTAGRAITVALPFAARAEEATVLRSGLVYYDNGNGSSTVASLKDDASIQLANVIDSPRAPNQYQYGFDLPAGAKLQRLVAGGAQVLNSDGQILLNIAAPVARDARGDSVESYYKVDGSFLIQVVDLAGTDSFPVVADPWLGFPLIKKATVTYPYSDKKKYKVNVTPHDNSAFVGQLTWGAWESELKTKLGSNASKVTYVVREQLNCHLAGYPASLPEFNLESWRKSMTWNAMSPYFCNYPEGGWGSKS